MTKRMLRTCAVMLIGTIWVAGCGGGSGGAASSAGNPSGNGPTSQVTGVATPSSVAVVTATNAS